MKLSVNPILEDSRPCDRIAFSQPGKRERTGGGGGKYGDWHAVRGRSKETVGRVLVEDVALGVLLRFGEARVPVLVGRRDPDGRGAQGRRKEKSKSP